MDLATFYRVYGLRSRSIMWLFGAGTSAASGVSTAWEMMWEFKRSLYCSEKRMSVSRLGDLTNPRVQAEIDAFCRTLPGCPPDGSNEDYAYFFEKAYPDEADRRRYIESKILTGTPSFGHKALGLLFGLDHVRLVWTTNFDKLVEDCALDGLGSASRLVVSTLDSSEIALGAINENRWPVIVKMHGDFQSRRLKNTTEELLTQDANIRQALISSCKRFGLAVVGYSGRDDSVMAALEAAVEKGAFPFGLFWFKRTGGTVFPRVNDLIEKAKMAGIQSELIDSETFDELFGDLLPQLSDVPDESLKKLNANRSRLSPVKLAAIGKSKNWPVLRTNALPLISVPSVCRHVLCEIGNTKEVKQVVERAGVKVLAARRRSGVIAFGSDADIRKCFGAHDIKGLDLFSIEEARLTYESAEFGLIYEALAWALERERHLKVNRAHQDYVAVIDRAKVSDPQFRDLRKIGNLVGNIGHASWSEAIRFRIDYKMKKLWLLIEPTIWVDEINESTLNFIRERKARRYNKDWNDLLQGWASVLCGGKGEAELRAIGVSTGVDAAFTLSAVTGFSRP